MGKQKKFRIIVIFSGLFTNEDILFLRKHFKEKFIPKRHSD